LWANDNEVDVPSGEVDVPSGEVHENFEGICAKHGETRSVDGRGIPQGRMHRVHDRVPAEIRCSATASVGC
jgi:hypothetical protein